MNIRYLLLSLCVLFVACGANSQKRVENTMQNTPTFSLPEIPVVIQTVEERLEYVLLHYWDNLDFCDTAYIHVPDVTEQALVNYIDLLNRTTPEVVDESLEILLQKASVEPKMFAYFNKTLRRYMVDPNSPLRNDELYEAVARYLSTSSKVDDVTRQRAERDLKLIALNRVGTPANDFVYTSPDGKLQKMSNLAAKTSLILFFDPDCHTCADVLDALQQSEIINSLLEKRAMQLLAIYPDEDKQLWKNYLKRLPSTWIHGHDEEQKILLEEIYDLQAMPTLYLLDEQKNVLLKDATVRQIEHFLSENKK